MKKELLDVKEVQADSKGRICLRMRRGSMEFDWILHPNYARWLRDELAYELLPPGPCPFVRPVGGMALEDIRSALERIAAECWARSKELSSEAAEEVRELQNLACDAETAYARVKRLLESEDGGEREGAEALRKG